MAGGQGLTTNQVGGVGLRGIVTAFGLTDPVVVAVDDIHVTAYNCGGVSAEGASWGAIKATYR